jgi:hypothetical protein
MTQVKIVVLLRNIAATGNASCIFFLVVKGPAADATDAPQPRALSCYPVMKIKMMIIFCPFPSNGAPVEWNWQGETEELGEKPVPVPLCPPQIPHWLTRDRTRASAVGGRRLTAWAMARQCILYYLITYGMSVFEAVFLSFKCSICRRLELFL